MIKFNRIFPPDKQEEMKRCRLFIRIKRKSLESEPLLPRTNLEFVKKGGKKRKEKNSDEQTRGNLIGFSPIHLLVPRFSTDGFPPQWNPEAENSPRFRGRIPRPASPGFWVRWATRLIGSNHRTGSRPAAHRNRHFSDSIGRHRAKSNCGRESMRRLQ